MRYVHTIVYASISIAERDLIRRLDFCFSECGYRNNCTAFNKVTKEKMENNKKLFSRL
jgi:hypothetical protein